MAPRVQLFVIRALSLSSRVLQARVQSADRLGAIHFTNLVLLSHPGGTMQICNHGLVERRKIGTTATDGVEKCNSCGLPTEIPKNSAEFAALLEALLPQERTPEWRRSRNRRTVEALREVSGKYAQALDGEGFSAISIIGTDSWEGYASLSIRAMTLETLTDLSEAVATLNLRLESLEASLTRGEP